MVYVTGVGGQVEHQKEKKHRFTANVEKETQKNGYNIQGKFTERSTGLAVSIKALIGGVKPFLNISILFLVRSWMCDGKVVKQHVVEK